MKKYSLTFIIVLTTISLAWTIIYLAQRTEQQRVEVTVRLPIPFEESTQAPFYVAEDQGFYGQEDIVVKHHQGSAELNPVKMVSIGSDMFGVVGGPDTLLVARSTGQPLVAIAIVHKDSNFPVIVTKQDSGIDSIEQLHGKKMAFFYGHISTDILRNAVRKVGVVVEEVNVPGYDYSQLIAGQVDAQYGWSNLAPVTFKEINIPINIISPADYGIYSHGYTIFTTEKVIEEHPDIVAKYLAATLKGIEFTVQHPEQVIRENVYPRNESIDIDAEIQRMRETNEVTSASEQYPIGYMDVAMFQETYDRLLEEGVIKNEFDVTSAFTTEFLDKIHNDTN